MQCFPVFLSKKFLTEYTVEKSDISVKRLFSVRLFCNGISFFLSYLKPKPSLLKPNR